MISVISLLNVIISLTVYVSVSSLTLVKDVIIIY